VFKNDENRKLLLFFLISCLHYFFIVNIEIGGSSPSILPNSQSSSAGKSVSFTSIFSLPIYHWDRCVERTILIDDTINGMAPLVLKIRAAFREELYGKYFRFYSMPADFSDVNDRVRVQSWGEMSIFFSSYLSLADKGKAPPLLYIFDEDSSPAKLPARQQQEDRSQSESSSNSSSNSSCSSSNRSRIASINCHKRDGNTCVFCGYFDSSSRDAAHLFEVMHSSKLDDESLYKTLGDLQIDNINALSNLLSLCKQCHKYFDHPHYSIGIGLDHKLIVSKGIRDKVTQGGVPLASLHGTPVEFKGQPCHRPTPALLQYRLTFFESVSNGKRALEELIEVRQNSNPQCSSEGAPSSSGLTKKKRK